MRQTQDSVGRKRIYSWGLSFGVAWRCSPEITAIYYRLDQNISLARIQNSATGHAAALTGQCMCASNDSKTCSFHVSNSSKQPCGTRRRRVLSGRGKRRRAPVEHAGHRDIEEHEQSFHAANKKAADVSGWLGTFSSASPSLSPSRSSQAPVLVFLATPSSSESRLSFPRLASVCLHRVKALLVLFMSSMCFMGGLAHACACRRCTILP